MRVLLVAGLLLARARRAGARWLLVAAAVALATVPLVAGPAVGATTSAAALRRGVTELPAGEQSLTVSTTGLPERAVLARLDGVARDALGGLGAGPVRRQVLFNELADRSGASFRLAVSDDLNAVTRLVSGRLPAACRPERCEVVLLAPRSPAGSPAGSTTGTGTGTAAEAGTGTGLDLDPELALVPVGRVERTDPLLLGGTFDPGDAVPVLLAAGGHDLAAPARLSGFGRAYGWVSRWDADRVVRVGVDGWLARATRAGTRLAQVTPGVVLTVPADVLRREAARAELSARRLGLLAAGSCVVLLAAAVVGGAALRRDHESFTSALTSRGAGPGLVTALLVGEAAVTVVLGVLAGLLAGAGAAAGLASAGGLPVTGTVRAALAASLPPVGALAVVAAGLLVAAVTAPAPAPGRGAGLWRALEGGAIACLGAAALLVSRGGVTAGAAGGSGGQGPGGAGGAPAADPLLTALPILLLAAAALVVARAWPALARIALRLSPRRALGLRLGLATVAGRPGRPAATAAVLTAAVAAAVFAAGYAATLDRGAAEQAAHAVPLDVRLLPGAGLAPPQDAVPPDRLAAALPGSRVTPVVRTAGSVRIGPQQADVVQLVGIDPGVLPGIARWAAVTGSDTDPATLATRLAGPPPPTSRTLPAGRRLRITTSGDAVQVAVTAYLRAPDGRERAVPLAVDRASGQGSAAQGTGAPGGAGLVAELPALTGADGRPVRLDLVALAVRQPTDAADRRLHALGEGTNDLEAPAGALTLGAVEVDGKPSASPWLGWSSGTAAAAARVAAGGASVRLDYRLTGGPGILVPERARGVVPVAVDPLTATTAGSGGGGLVLLIDGVPFDAVPVAVLDGFPTASGRFAVLDADLLADLVERTQPGTATPAELWVTGAWTGAAPPAALDPLRVLERSRTEAALRADPVARAATGLLLAGAALGLVVALAAVALLVVSQGSDEAAVHYAWEADGVLPGTLRAGLLWGAVAVVVPGTLAGALAGLGLSALAARLVAVTASATEAVPPLHAEAGDPWVLAASAGAVVLTLAVAAAVAARSLREPLPVRRGGWSR